MLKFIGVIAVAVMGMMKQLVSYDTKTPMKEELLPGIILLL